jgi:hypothetical protein
LSEALKYRAMLDRRSGHNDVYDLALFLCARLRVILLSGACHAAGLYPFQTDGAAK